MLRTKGEAPENKFDKNQSVVALTGSTEPNQQTATPLSKNEKRQKIKERRSKKKQAQKKTKSIQQQKKILPEKRIIELFPLCHENITYFLHKLEQSLADLTDKTAFQGLMKPLYHILEAKEVTNTELAPPNFTNNKYKAALLDSLKDINHQFSSYETSNNPQDQQKLETAKASFSIISAEITYYVGVEPLLPEFKLTVTEEENLLRTNKQNRREQELLLEKRIIELFPENYQKIIFSLQNLEESLGCLTDKAICRDNIAPLLSTLKKILRPKGWNPDLTNKLYVEKISDVLTLIKNQFPSSQTSNTKDAQELEIVKKKFFELLTIIASTLGIKSFLSTDNDKDATTSNNFPEEKRKEKKEETSKEFKQLPIAFPTAATFKNGTAIFKFKSEEEASEIKRLLTLKKGKDSSYRNGNSQEIPIHHIPTSMPDGSLVFSESSCQAGWLKDFLSLFEYTTQRQKEAKSYLGLRAANTQEYNHLTGCLGFFSRPFAYSREARCLTAFNILKEGLGVQSTATINGTRPQEIRTIEHFNQISRPR